VLFLLNDELLDLAEDIARLEDVFRAERTVPTLFKAVTLGQQVIFAGGTFRSVHRSAVVRVATMIAMSSEANAALFVRPDGATDPRQVGVRLASAPLTTMARLADYQRERPLSPALINGHVWSLAGAASAA
jgi:hypothetical protein